MNRNQVIIVNLLMSILFLLSCSEDGLTVMNPESDVRIEKGIEPTVCNLSESDAKSVALCEMGNITRASSSNEIKEVIPLTDEKGEAYAYVVNFEKGFILISATTTYYPILGFSDESIFDKSYIHQNGLGIILTQLKGEVQKSNQLKSMGLLNIGANM